MLGLSLVVLKCVFTGGLVMPNFETSPKKKKKRGYVPIVKAYLCGHLFGKKGGSYLT